MAMGGGKRFIKKVPASGLAPAYKLTLPHQVVHKNLAHLVGIDFELASSVDGPTWPGSITPRRNKDRSEYTLKGWKMFAEAHRVQLGDHVSFELVGETRLLAQVISARGNVVEVDYRDYRDSPSRSRSLSAPSSPSKSPKRSKMDSPEVDVASDALPDPLSDDLVFDLFSPSSVFGDRWSEGRDFPDMPESPTALSFDDLSGAVGFPATPDKVAVDLNTQTGQPGKSSSLSWHPQKSGGLESSPNSSGLPTPTTPTTGISHARSAPAGAYKMLKREDGLNVATYSGNCKAPTANQTRSCSHLDLQLLDLGSTMQSLQADIKVHEERAKHAEQEEARLRFFLDDARTKLQQGLQAAAGLERVASRLADNQFLASSPHGGPSQDKLQATQEEMRACLDTLKDSLWQVLSTDI